MFQKHILYYCKVASVKNCKHTVTLQITWWGGLTCIIQLDFLKSLDDVRTDAHRHKGTSYRVIIIVAFRGIERVGNDMQCSASLFSCVTACSEVVILLAATAAAV